MRLSELGELGLLSELERLALARGIGDDAAQLDGTERASTPRPPATSVCARVRQLACAHAMIDLSDGLAADGARIADRSGCRLVAEVAARIGNDVWELACGFGEDYELLAAVSDPLAFPAVGRCEKGSGFEIRLGGEVVSLDGWEHFR